MDYILNIYEFYKNQGSQLAQLDTINDWFINLESTKNIKHIKIEQNKKSKKLIGHANVLVIVGDTGVGKSNILSRFLKNCSYDILEIGKLFDIYENTNIYSIKDFIPKILKQKTVSNLFNKKLLVIDSLEEFIVIQKTIIRDIIENIEFLNMPVIIVVERKSFDNLEKKILAKLNKEATIADIEKPNHLTMKDYIQLKYPNTRILEDIDFMNKIIDYSNGDFRNLDNTVKFYSISDDSHSSDNYNKDCVLDTEKAIIEFSEGNLSDTFYRCESDPFIFGMLTYENYIYCKAKENTNKKNIINMICFSDYLEKKLFKYQQWDLLEVYAYYSTIYPWKQLETPKKILSTSTLQKYMNTKKRNRKATLDF
jgi:GTPase SAR1 family protein